MHSLTPGLWSLEPGEFLPYSYKKMGYYSPQFANLASGWYFSTSEPKYAVERDECLLWWDSSCDAVLDLYVRRFGMFLTAFEPQIRDEVRRVLGHHLTVPRYFGYFIVSRVLAIPHLREAYEKDYRRRAHEQVVCEICSKVQSYDEIHPSLIGRTKRVLPLCNSCWFWVAEFTPLENLSHVSEDLRTLVRRLQEEQLCPVCGRQFKWLDRQVRYTFEIPFIPSRHIEICPKCVARAVLRGPEADNSQIYLVRFKQVADLLGAIPSRHGKFFDQVDSLESAVCLTKLLFKLPRLEDLARIYGSWFKLLVVSGVLPSGTRRTQFGTMVLAEDGHQCLSLAEKTIDDLLHRHGIPHDREPQYVDANYRADWIVSDGESDVYIELFGLDGQPAYTRRMREKLCHASKVGMTVIALDRNDLRDLNRAFYAKVLPRVGFTQASPHVGFATD